MKRPGGAMLVSLRTMILRGGLAAAFCLAAAGAGAECANLGDILGAEQAARAYAEAPGPAARARLFARLDALTAAHDGAEGHGTTTVGLFIATRRMLPVVTETAGAAAASAYVADPAYARPLDILTAAGTSGVCGALASADADAAAPVDAARGAAAGDANPQAPAPVAALPFDLENLAAPDLRYLLGLALLIAVALLAPRGRRERRFVVYHPAEVRTEAGARNAHVLDISRSGAKLRMAGGAANGQLLDLRLGDDAHWAEVRWTRDDMFGVLFGERLPRADFRRFLRRAREGAGVAPAGAPGTAGRRADAPPRAAAPASA